MALSIHVAGTVPTDLSSVSIGAASQPRRRIARPLRLACIVLPVLLFGALAWGDYEVELARTRNDVVTSTNAIAEHAKTVVETVDLVISRVLDHIGQQDWPTLATSLETHEFLDRLRHELPQVEAVYLIDPDGLLAASSRAYPMPRYDLNAAGYFAKVKEQDSDAAVISGPFNTTRSGTNGFMISRRRTLNGRFDGVVGVTVSRQYFEDFYRVILDQPDASAAGLVRLDGTVLVRFPDSPVRIDVLPPTNLIMQAVRDGAQSGLISGQSTEDGRERIGAFRRVTGLPLLAGYGIDRSVFLTTWAVHAGVMAFCAILLSALLLLAESLARRNAETESTSLRRLVEETERRRQLEARAQEGQKMEALGRLTGGVAHDFNNLLAVIVGSLELVLRRESEPRKVRLLTAAAEAAQRGAKLTTQMLAFSRKHEIAVRPVDVNSVIRGMDELLLRTLGPGIRLHYDLAGDLWPALADPTQLELALLNLAVNARDAMPDGGRLSFRTAVAPDAHREVATLVSGDYVRIEVADTGTGMTEDVQARALEPFFTTKGPGGGTGLGLSMVSGFLNEIGGALTIESAAESGTTISLFLRKSDLAPAAAPIKPAAAVTVRQCRILLVDDDENVRASVRAMLDDLGHDVVEAGGGAETLEILTRDRRFDLLVLDFAMPAMNGAQLAVNITEFWPSAPMLFVTGYVENDGLRPWTDRGYRTLRKPFGSHELAIAIQWATDQPETVAS